MDLELRGKVVLITGGSDGLGRALAGRLCAEGVHVAICARDERRLEEAVGEVTERGEASGFGGGVIGVRADVSVLSDLERFVAESVETWGRIDGVVNNAGRASAAAVADVSDEEWDADFTLKLHAASRLVRLALPHLKENGGAIVNVLAIAAKTPGAGSAPSAVSRAAGMALTKVLSKELGTDGIRVNAVLIGLIASGQWERRADARQVSRDEFYESLAVDAGVPLGRVGRGEEFADVVAFLLSSRASYVTGSAVNIDGGLCAVV